MDTNGEGRHGGGAAGIIVRQRCIAFTLQLVITKEVISEMLRHVKRAPDGRKEDLDVWSLSERD